MTFKLLKRRYRSSDDDERMRKLEYFHQPYEPGNEIKLIDDVELSKPLMMLEMHTEMVALEDVKRGKKNAVQREEKSNDVKRMHQMIEFDPFDEDKSLQF